MTTHTFKDAKLVFKEYDSENGLREERLLGPLQHFTIPIEFQWNEEAVEFFKWLGWRMLPSITPDGTTRGACLGVWAWRMLAELQAPLHRRAAMAPFWIRAMQARYAVCADSLRGCFVPGNQREVIAVYDRIRREAGDFDDDELGGLN